MSTEPDERDEPRRRVWPIEDRLFMMAEAPHQTPFTVDVVFDRLEELAAGLNVVIRAVAKLTAFAIGFRSVSFHTTVDEATEACRRALR